MTLTIEPDQYVHTKLPSGFTYANEIQVKSFEATGSVHGASKVAIVDEGRGIWLAIHIGIHVLEYLRSLGTHQAPLGQAPTVWGFPIKVRDSFPVDGIEVHTVYTIYA